MDKEQIIALAEKADETATQYLQCAGEYHPDYHYVRDEHFYHAAIESYKADLLKGVGKPVLYAEFAEDGGWLGAASECADHLEEPHALFTSYQVAAAIIKATKPLEERRCEICGYAEHHREHTGCLRTQLAASQAYAEQLRKWVIDNCMHADTCDCLSLDDEGKHMACSCGLTAALASDTSALDAYVANQREAAYQEARRAAAQFEAELARQRDLAVEALEDVRKELQQSNDRLNEEREIWDRVMGDGVKKLERLELELDDCLYVLESLWDKTCNKEVTEKWAGILIRNKRGIGASSAEDSSEQTTA